MTSSATNPNGESFRESLKKPFDVITYRGTWSMFREIYRLFDQATFCFDAKAYDAVCIMCRATIEAACYVFLTRKREVGLLISPPRTLDGRVRKVPFPELERGMKKVLSERQMSALARIKDLGDFIAHLVEKSDRQVWASLNSNPTVNPHEAITEIGEKEAVESLQDVISIFPTIAYEAAKTMKLSGASTVAKLSNEEFEKLQRESDPKNW